MNCEAFDRWLDDGRLPEGEAAARAHAESCARCAQALRVALEIEAELEGFAAPAPAEFTARVMARIAAAEAMSQAQSPLAWWVRAASEPAAVLALVVAGMVLLWGDALRRLAAPAMVRLIAALSNIETPRPTFLAHPDVPLALALSAAPFVLWGSWRLYAIAERACQAGVVRRS